LADKLLKTVQIALPQNRVKEVLQISMEDLQEGIWILTKPLTSLYRYTAGCL
jgi:hypothetical protein